MIAYSVYTSSLALAFSIALAAPAWSDSFGSGDNSFEIEFVEIGHPGNSNDSRDGDFSAPGVQRYGAVDYKYRLGKFEVSEGMIDKVNAAGNLSLKHHGNTYGGSLGPNRAAWHVNWADAARFTNWLNTSTGNPPAYKFVGNEFMALAPGEDGYSPTNPYRHSRAVYFLPSVDEWYKGAYFDPELGDYHDFTVGSSSTPDGFDDVVDAAFDVASTSSGVLLAREHPENIDNAGLPSPLGTFAQGGNVYEWNETDSSRNYSSSSSVRAIRGGAWSDPVETTASRFVFEGDYQTMRHTIGFRVASQAVVPEPDAILLATWLLIAQGLWRLRHSGVTSVPG